MGNRPVLSKIIVIMAWVMLCGLVGCAGNGAGKKESGEAGTTRESEVQASSESGEEILTADLGNVLDEELAAFAESISWEEVHVKVPGMQGSKRFLYLSDLHLITESDQIAADQLGNVRARMDWSSFGGMTAAEAWPVWVDYFNAVKTDGILFGADMVDFASRSNVECLKKGLDRLEKPWLYVRADHDLAPSYLDGVFETESIGYQVDVGDAYADVMTMEFDEFIIAGWNNSTGQLSQAGLERMEEVFSLGKPVILLTHVPIQPLHETEEALAVEGSLTHASKEAWGGRALLWGNQGTECTYKPNETTQEFLGMIYDDQTPLCEILCGHLHFTWDGMVTERVHQHVFGPALGRSAGIITVDGE